jgi:hypothetical protein
MVVAARGVWKWRGNPSVIAAGTVGRNVLFAQVGEEIRRY